MRVGKHITLRRVILFAWVLMLLLIVAPVLAQDGGETTTTATTATTTDSGPDDLTGVAVELAPLMLGAALIERLLEYIFTLAETSLLRAGSIMQRFLQWINGTLMVDARDVYSQYERIRKALLAYHAGLVDETLAKNAASDNPDDWPFDKVLEQFDLYGAKVSQLDEWLKTTTSSEGYINRRKTVASLLGIAFGLLLAGFADIRLFQPLEFGPSDGWFDVLDLIAAGVLMGLGTDYVHQIISVVTKGQRYLGAATGRQTSETVQIDVESLKLGLDTQLKEATSTLDERFAALEKALSNLGVKVDDSST